MRYYAAWGHTEFVLCLGYKGDVVSEYFLNYNEALSNDFVLTERRRRERRAPRARTSATGGSPSSTPACSRRSAERLKAVEPYLAGDEMFLATYGDGLTDAPLDDMIVDAFEQRGKTGQFLSVRPRAQSRTVVITDERGRGRVSGDEPDSRRPDQRRLLRLPRELLDWIEPGDELVEETFARLIPRRRGRRIPVRRVLGPMDTIKDKQRLEALHERAARPGERRVHANASLGRPDAHPLARGGEPPSRARARDRLPCRRPRDRLRGDDARADPRATGSRGDVGRARRATATAGTRRGRAPRTLPRGRGGRRGRVHGFRDGYMPYVGGEVKDVFEELKRRRAGPRPHAHARRPAPGPSPRLRAHVEHVPRSPDPRVRDPEVGRRPRAPERLTCRSRRTIVEEKLAARCAALPEPGRKALVRRGDVPRPHALARAGVRATRGTRRRSRPKIVRDGALTRACASSSPGTTATSAPSSRPCCRERGHEVAGLDTSLLRGMRLRSDLARVRTTLDSDVRDVTPGRPPGLRRRRAPRGAVERPDRRPQRSAGRTTSTSTRTLARRTSGEGGGRRAASSSRRRARCTARRAPTTCSTRTRHCGR